MSTRTKGFTLIELLIVIAIVGILSVVVLLAINPAKIMEETNYNTAVSNLNQIAKASQLYEVETGEVAPDGASRGIPSVFMKYLGPGNWPAGPFGGSIYDWDNWTGQTCWDGSQGGTQISLRDITKYKGNTYTAGASSTNQLALYFVIQGDGIPHCSNSSVKGYCVNCPSLFTPAP